MPNLVVMGASCQCNQGTTPSSLMVLPVKGVSSGYKPAANINDYIPLMNILPFGMCQSMQNPMVIAATAAALGTKTPAPCIPVTTSAWSPGAKKTNIAGKPALTKTCKLKCAWGGGITISNPSCQKVMTD
ncbi:MAG: DUF4280 domain-containing protein [Flavobacteriales bacterium]